MEDFKISLHQLFLLSESCIPPAGEYKMAFWRSLVDSYWFEMSESQRAIFFNLMRDSEKYQDSLTHEETQIFDARFDPENQYLVYSKLAGNIKTNVVFKRNGHFYANRETILFDEHIVSVMKLASPMLYTIPDL
jgi:hypothetical protein